MTKVNNKLRILLADDHELIRCGIRGILKSHRGWTVVAEAVDGEGAVEKTHIFRPDVVILDVTMPRLDGLEATRQILATEQHTRVLILTMHESDQMVRRVLEAGARGYVLKSDLSTQLVNAVRQVARGNLFLTPKISQIVVQGFLDAQKVSRRNERAESRPSPREVEIIRLLAQGRTNKEIAAALDITFRTVQTHRANIMHKLALHSLTELIHYAIRNKIATLPSPGT